MEFDEVNHFVKHGKPASTTLDDRSIAALAIGTPYYPDFPYPQTFSSINNKKRPITAKFVDTVRHRLRKSSSVSTSVVSSDTEDHNLRHRRKPPPPPQQQQQQRRPLKRVQTSPLKNKNAATTVLFHPTPIPPPPGPIFTKSKITKEPYLHHHQYPRRGGRRLFRLRKHQNHGQEKEERGGGYYSLDDSLYHRKKRRPATTTTATSTTIATTTGTTAATTTRSTKTGLWKRRRRRRRPSSAVEISSPMDLPIIKTNHNGIASTRTAGLIPLRSTLSTKKLADLQVISDEMRSFSVPSDWACVSRKPSVSVGSPPPVPPLLESLDRQRGTPIRFNHVLDEMTEGVYRYQYLCDQEEQRIETSRQEIEEYVQKLQQLDRDVDQLNTKIVLARYESMKRMEHMLQETQQRLPLVKKAWMRHKKTVVAIEGYNKSMNYAERLTDLQSKVIQARQRQVTWNCFQRWIPSIGIITILHYIYDYYYKSSLFLIYFH
ncbi:hypothetical protein BDA99DRAFT_516571 [Phascolomyces articulosus]|uniref:Uncharacterized protein n=1 Tax=Phascolomyces articulosus TaxID=60185 RepID=A0AAD5K625_9FUNG|nr:hypothetical protein BDA99DRAFT_516571 [Phascolomyces articulosus]